MYNTKRWAMTRRSKLNASPICERCGDALATEVHHKHSLDAGGAPWSPANLESLCKSCHSQRTRKEQLSGAN